MLTPAILNRARGALLGQATGDALGTTVEFLPSATATQALPHGPLEITGGGTFRVLAGQITDDTELALALARSLASRGRYDEDDVATAYVRWYRSAPFDCGGTVGRAFGIPASATPTAAALRARTNATSQANGALMRVSPLAVWGWRLEPDTLAELAVADASLSHPHPVCLAANVVFTHLIARAIRTGDGPDALLADTLAWAAGRADCALASPIIEAGLLGPPSDYYAHMGWLRIALQNATYQLTHAPDLREGVEDTVRHGGDSDTNAAIVGALLGAAHGADAIPAQWRQVVLACHSPRPAEYQCADLGELADGLARAGASFGEAV